MSSRMTRTWASARRRSLKALPRTSRSIPLTCTSTDDLLQRGEYGMRLFVNPFCRRRSGGFTRAFTLVELMVSIAVALLLILGVNQVFRATSQTTGAGQALSTEQRYSRTVKTTLSNDLHNGAWDSHVLIIR